MFTVVDKSTSVVGSYGRTNTSSCLERAVDPCVGLGLHKMRKKHIRYYCCDRSRCDTEPGEMQRKCSRESRLSRCDTELRLGPLRSVHTQRRNVSRPSQYPCGVETDAAAETGGVSPPSCGSSSGAGTQAGVSRPSRYPGGAETATETEGFSQSSRRSCGAVTETSRVSQAAGHRPAVAEAEGPQSSQAQMDTSTDVAGGTSGRERTVRRMSNQLKLNVGGTLFETSTETLTIDSKSVLSVMVKRRDGAPVIFIDRDPDRFSHVLNYLRNGTIWLEDISTLRAVEEEADFYCLAKLKLLCAEKIQQILKEDEERVSMDKILEAAAKAMQVEWERLTARNLPTGLPIRSSCQPISISRRRRFQESFTTSEDF